MSATKDEIRRALTLLRINEMNYLKTSKDTGIARTTLKKWALKDGLEEERPKGTNPNVIDLLTDIRPPEVVSDKVRIAEKIIKAQEKAIDRLLDQLNYCNDAETTAKIFKMITEAQGIFNHLGELPGILTSPQTFIQIVNNQILNKTQESHE